MNFIHLFTRGKIFICSTDPAKEKIEVEMEEMSRENTIEKLTLLLARRKNK